MPVSVADVTVAGAPSGLGQPDRSGSAVADVADVADVAAGLSAGLSAGLAVGLAVGLAGGLAAGLAAGLSAGLAAGPVGVGHVVVASKAELGFAVKDQPQIVAA